MTDCLAVSYHASSIWGATIIIPMYSEYFVFVWHVPTYVNVHARVYSNIDVARAQCDTKIGVVKLQPVYVETDPMETTGAMHRGQSNSTSPDGKQLMLQSKLWWSWVLLPRHFTWINSHHCAGIMLPWSMRTWVIRSEGRHGSGKALHDRHVY